MADDPSTFELIDVEAAPDGKHPGDHIAFAVTSLEDCLGQPGFQPGVFCVYDANEDDPPLVEGGRFECDLIVSYIAHLREQLGSPGARLIAAERLRQVEGENWSPEHDDEHTDDELSYAATAYLWVSRLCQMTTKPERLRLLRPETWPWDYASFKPSDDPVVNLTKAGALIAAEIDRLLRAKASTAT